MKRHGQRSWGNALRAALTAVGTSFALSAAGNAAEWPADSLYHVDVAMQTSLGTDTRFAANEGRARVVSMFYATCPMACPLTIETLRHIEHALSPGERARLGIVLVTLDPERDTPAALHALARERRVDEKRWTLARVSPSDTRKLAAALGVQYRQLDDGNFDHSSVLILLDASGRMLARSGKMGVPDPGFIEAVRKATAAGAG